jgi:hypothetical protein
MTVAEGSAMLILEAGESTPDNAIAELLGGGSVTRIIPQHRIQKAGSSCCYEKGRRKRGYFSADIEYINLTEPEPRTMILPKQRLFIPFLVKIFPLSSVKELLAIPRSFRRDRIYNLRGSHSGRNDPGKYWLH